MIIKKPQIDHFKADLLRNFTARLVRHLRHSFPERTRSLSDVKLTANVDGFVKIGLQIGFATEVDLASFAECALVIGLDLDHVSVHSYLVGNQLPARAKLDHLRRVMLETLFIQ